MDDSIGFFLTWATYGTWLPGDSRGWAEYQHGWQLPDPARELDAAARMSEDACRLSHEQRTAVEDPISETCCNRRWQLHAVNCRSNHLHVVVSASGVHPKKIRADLKAWATRGLKMRFDAHVRTGGRSAEALVGFGMKMTSLQRSSTYWRDKISRKPSADTGSASTDGTQ